MKHNRLTKIANIDWHPKRSNRPVYTCETVLSTGFQQTSKINKFEENLNKIKALYRDAFFVHFEMQGNDAHKLIYSVTNVLYALNQSRPLRRHKVTGIRACCLDTQNPKLKYICDLGFTSFFNAAVVVSGLLKYAPSKYVDVFFKGQRVGGRSRKQAMFEWHKLNKEKFFSRTGLSQYSVCIEDISEETYITPSLGWRITSPRMDLLDIIHSLVEVFGEDVEEVHFNSGWVKIDMTRYVNINVEQYVERPFDKVLYPIRFKRFTAFGRFHLDPEFIIY